ncbi:hypothetical protein [Yoonia sp. R2-816]|uniref:hypothetical protein n=1 Tax=Yoonia sp. R2-816 TaxID=3342638 RepID=UPI00372C08C6
MTRAAVLSFTLSALPVAAQAFCDPPLPPAPTSETLAREYEAEFEQGFERYFSEASGYFRCLDEERGKVMSEVEQTANRYDRFLTDAETWGEE